MSVALTLASSPCQPVWRSAMKYFGFFGSSMEWLSPPSVTDQVKGFVNHIWIASNHLSFILQELAKAKADGLKAVISGINLYASNIPPATYGPALQPYVTDGTIIGFYVFDDDLGNFGQWGGVAGVNENVAQLKGAFPGTHAIGFLSNYGPNFALTSIPNNIDWIGWEMYGEGWAGDNWPLSHLYSILNPQQRQIIVPSVNIDLKAITLLVAPYPKVIGIVPFLWQSSGDAGLDQYSYSTHPAAMAQAVSVGTCFKSKPSLIV